jgi:putative copper resistance protein D
VDAALIAWRFVHFTATVQAAGILLFCTFVLRGLETPADTRRRLARFFWLSVAAALVSGVGWLLSVAGAIDDASWIAALQNRTVTSVVTDTQFGNAWSVRLAAGLALAITQMVSVPILRRTIVLLSTTVFVGGLAFAGHGASTPGTGGDVHLTADILHLLAVTVWVGGLLPYTIALGAVSKRDQPAALDLLRTINRRYSDLAAVAVLTIIATGIVNTLNLVGSARMLITTDYGRLLSLKLVIFSVMLALAAVNRFVLVRRTADGDRAALMHNAMIEFGLAAAVLLLVAAFGTMPPPLLDGGSTPG